MRRAARIDQNHTEVVKALRGVGCSVVSLAAVGNGVPDLLVSRAGNTILVEVKNGSKGKMTDDQIQFALHWNGRIVRADSPTEAVDKVLRYT